MAIFFREPKDKMDSGSSSSQSKVNLLIGLGIVGIYAGIAYLMFMKKPASLGDVLRATDFSNPEECKSIFNKVLSSTNTCGPYASTAFCDACADPSKLSPAMQSMCAEPSTVAMCKAAKK